MRKIISLFLKKASLSVFLLAAAFTQSNASGDADPTIDVSTIPYSIPLGGNGVLMLVLNNIGQTTDIVANSLEATISVGGNVEIMGILPGSSADWGQQTLSAGTGNTIKIRNFYGGVEIFAPDTVYLSIKGTVVLPIYQTVTAHIQYFNYYNPLLGGLQNVTQGNMTTSTDNNTTSVFVTAPLPISLSSFTAEAEGCSTLLNWTSTEEQNFDHFVVESSSDGRTYHALATVKSKNNPTGSSYEYLAEQPTGLAYYRLKMVDVDGQFKYSEVQSVRTNCNTTATWSVYPDPARENEPVHIKLNAGNDMKTVQVKVVDVLGRLVVSMQHEVVAGENIYSLPSLANGTYMVSLINVQGNQINQTQKLIIAK